MQLKGGDAILYHAFKVYKISPELRWTAGGYIWSAEQTVNIVDDEEPPLIARPSYGLPSRQGVPPLRGAFSVQGDHEDEETEDIRVKVERSGAIPIEEAEVSVLTDQVYTGPVTKVRVPFVASNGELERLVVNALMVVYVP